MAKLLDDQARMTITATPTKDRFEMVDIETECGDNVPYTLNGLKIALPIISAVRIMHDLGITRERAKVTFEAALEAAYGEEGSEA